MQLTSILTTATLAGLSLAAPTMDKRAPFEGQYTVIAHRPGFPFDGLEIQAAGEGFYLGPNAGPASYCPTSVVQNCPNTTDTVWAGGSLWVEVPGGQQIYTQTNGAVAFTQAHSASEPNLLEGAPGALADGTVVGPDNQRLTACPVADQKQTWQLFVEVPGFNQTGCTCITATAEKWNSSDFGAWEYI